MQLYRFYYYFACKQRKKKRERERKNDVEVDVGCYCKREREERNWVYILYLSANKIIRGKRIIIEIRRTKKILSNKI